MSTDQLQQKHPFVSRTAWLGIPIIAGVLVDGASESLKFVAHGTAEQLKVFLQMHIGYASDLWDAPLALGFCIALLVVAMVLLEKFGDPRPWVRNSLLVISLVIVGTLEPWQFFHREHLLHTYDKVHFGESLADVLKAIDEPRPWIEPHEDRVRDPPNSYIYCDQNCWMRLRYDVPSLWSTQFVEIDFDAQQRVCHKKLVL